MSDSSLTVVEFDGIVGFLDIAGFTAATERFGAAGARGTEALGHLINSLFTPATSRVHAVGGEVGWFAGDAIGVLFDRSVTTDEHALAALVDASRALGELTPIDTLIGPVELGVKVGVAAGRVRWNTLDAASAHAWYSGEPIDLAADAEHHANPGDVIVHDSLAGLVAGDLVASDGEGARFRRVSPSWSGTTSVVSARPLAGRQALVHQPTRVERVARAGDIALLDQHRSGTAVFVGLPGSIIDADVLHRVDAISSDFGGTVLSANEGDKGATALVFFGAPTALADRQRRSLLAACAIRSEFPGVACGVASGRVFAGRVGSDDRWDYSVLGDRVNIAARLLQAAAPGEILVDRFTLDAVSSGVESGPMRELSLKGKSEPEPATPLISLSDQVVEAPDGGPFVGRRRELQALHASLERPGVTLVVGPPGIGKSRLLRQATSGLAGDGPLRVAISETDRLRPLRLWRRVVQECGVVDASSAEQIVGAARAPFIDLVMGVAPGHSALLAEASDEDRAEILGSVLVEVMAAGSVSSIVVEDLHWADAASVDQVARLAGRLAEAGIALVATSRPESQIDEVMRTPGVEVEVLEALGDNAIAELADGLWNEAFGSPPNPMLAEELVERSSGVPLFCHQLVAWAAARGEAADVASLGDNVPATINDLMLARLDAVPEAAEPAISYGSVLAEPFATSDLSDAFGDRSGGGTIPGAVEILLDRELFVGFERHRFAHSLLREIAYGRLSFVLRQELHSAALAALERKGSTDVGELARHAGETADTDRQRQYFAAAAEQAADQYANGVALGWYQRLLPLLEAPESGRVRIELGRLEYIAGQLDVAAVLLADAIRETVGVDRDRAGLALGRVEIGQGDSTGFARIDEVMDRAEQAEEWGLAREAMEVAADVATMLGDIDRAEAVEARYLSWRERLGVDHPAAEPLPFLAGLVWMRGDLHAAATRYESVYQQFLDDGDLIHAGASAADLAGIYYEQGDVDAALDWLEVGAECFERVGHERSIVRLIRGNQVFIHTDLGDLEGARRLGLAAADRALFLGDLPTVGEILAALAPAAETLDEALALLAIAERLAQRLGNDAQSDDVALLRARAYAQFGAFGDAIAAAGSIAAEDDLDVLVDLAHWGLLAGGPAEAAVAQFESLRAALAPPAQLFRLADALATGTASSDWTDVARAQARLVADEGAPAALRGRVAIYVDGLPASVVLPTPEVDAIDAVELIERLRRLAPQGVDTSRQGA